MIYTEIKVSGIEDVEKRLGNMKKNAPLVVSRAINRAISNVKKNMGKETAARYFISSGEVKKTVNVTKASKSSLKAAAISQGGGIALSKFKVNPGTPVRYRGKSRSPKVYKAGVLKAGGVKPLDGDPKSFVAIMKSGHNGVFSRTTGKSLPLKQLYGPSVPQMVKNEDIMTTINKDANDTLQKRINAEVNNILRKG
ncbi:phage tail protein [Lacrimispora indolis]|uniref:phage tail protein n=1 Tax=Lacrimispora indolis TaxID=69825 RepID=UPI0003FD2592|nr:phage tail protein [[Clostridium] methoxybenzovorans]